MVETLFRCRSGSLSRESSDPTTNGGHARIDELSRVDDHAETPCLPIRRSVAALSPGIAPWIMISSFCPGFTTDASSKSRRFTDFQGDPERAISALIFPAIRLSASPRNKRRRRSISKRRGERIPCPPILSTRRLFPVREQPNRNRRARRLVLRGMNQHSHPRSTAWAPGGSSYGQQNTHILNYIFLCGVRTLNIIFCFCNAKKCFCLFL